MGTDGVTLKYLQEKVYPKVWPGDTFVLQMSSLEEAQLALDWLDAKGDSTNPDCGKGDLFIEFTKKKL